MVPHVRRRTGTNPISSRARISADDGTLYRLQTEFDSTGERPYPVRSVDIKVALRGAVHLLVVRGFRDSYRVSCGRERRALSLQANLSIGVYNRLIIGLRGSRQAAEYTC